METRAIGLGMSIVGLCCSCFAVGYNFGVKEEREMLNQYEISNLAPIPEGEELDMKKLKEEFTGEQWKDILAKLRRHGYEVRPIEKGEVKCQK